MKLDADEKAILESVERGEWRSTRGGKRERSRYARYAIRNAFDYGGHGAFLVMEYVHGLTLRSVLKRRHSTRRIIGESRLRRSTGHGSQMCWNGVWRTNRHDGTRRGRCAAGIAAGWPTLRPASSLSNRS